jgi:integrase
MASNATPSARRKPTTGISERHSRYCPSRSGGKCSAGRKDGCKVAFRAFVYDPRSGTKVRQTFPTLAAAKAWRADATSQINRGKMIAPSKQTFREAAEAWVAGATAEPPTILNRSGARFKPSTLRGYRADLDRYLLPDLGAHRLSDVRRADLQRLVDRLLGQGLGPSKVRNVVNAARVVFRHALERDDVIVNPTVGLRLPRSAPPRDRAASPHEAAQLLAALPEDVRVVYATAFYAGLRRGELQALRWTAVDLAAGVIVVSAGWDAVEGEITTKSRKGTRTVPLTALLRDALVEHKQRTGRGGTDLVFGRTGTSPFRPGGLAEQAAKAWAAENVRRAERNQKPLVPIGLHECRHTFVSLMHDAGLSLERIGDYVGHSSTYMTTSRTR